MISSYFTFRGLKAPIFSNDKRYIILLFILYLWMLRGIFPLYNYESDSMVMISGGSVLFNQGFSLPPDLSYQYNMQPLIVYIIGGLKTIFPFLTCECIYSAISAIFSLAFIPISVEFVHKLTSLSRVIILVSIILLPESYAIAMYPNSAIIPEVLSLIAFLMVLKRKSFLLSVLLLCVAPVFRIDIITIYPVLPFLFLLSQDSIRYSLYKSIFAGTIIVLFLAIVYFIFQANPFYILGKASEVNDRSNMIVPLLAIFAFYTPVNFILVPIGFALLLKRKKFLLLLSSIFPILLIHYIFRYNGGAAKHYLYILPFVSVLSCHPIEMFVNNFFKRKVTNTIILTLLIVYYIVSIRIDFPHRPWRNKPYSFSQLAMHKPLVEIDLFSKFQLGLGGGLGFTTADEIMLTTGGLFYSDYIHKLKVNKKRDIKKITKYLDDINSYKLITLEWGDVMLIPCILLENGYQYCRKAERLFDLQKGNSFITSYSKNAFYSSESITKVLTICKENMPKDSRPTYIISLSDSYMYALDEYSKDGKINKIMHGLYLVHL